MDPDVALLYKEILFLRSAIDNIFDRLGGLEKSVQDLTSRKKSKNRYERSLSPLQVRIAKYIEEQPKTQAEIQATLHVPQSSVSHSLNKLEKELNIVHSRPTSKPNARFEYILKKNLPDHLRRILAKL